MLRALSIVLVLTAAGCHRYVPTRAEQVPPGSQVRVEVTEEGARRAEPVLGYGTTTIIGELREWSERVVVVVDVPGGSSGVSRNLARPVVLEPSDVLGMAIEERDRTRTALLVGGIAAVVVGSAVLAFSGTFGGSPDRPRDEQPEGAVIPLGLRVFP